MFVQTIDWVTLAALTAVLPGYHLLLPLLRRRGERFTGGRRIRREIESWVRHLIEERQVIVAVQQVRNLTMVASTLCSATLIIMTLAGSYLLRGNVHTASGTFHLDPLTFKILVLFGALAIAFAAFVQCLTGLGRFTLLIGADPATLDRGEGDAAVYLTGMILGALRSFRDGIHFLSALVAVLFWMFDARFCLAVIALLAVKFVLFDDFVYLVRKRRRPLRPGHPKP